MFQTLEFWLTFYIAVFEIIFLNVLIEYLQFEYKQKKYYDVFTGYRFLQLTPILQFEYKHEKNTLWRIYRV